MILITIKLVSAIDESRSREIGRMLIANDGSGTAERGDYQIRLMRRGTIDVVQKTAEVKGFPRQSTVVWALVARALANLGIR